ncbi:MAG: YceI family protein [Campylobacterota bacterium]|nr:YceI family protein [Campylobacterota bacterium]
MFKVILALVATSVLIFSAELVLDENKSNVYYVAKKDQFFSTYEMIGVNKVLSGAISTQGDLISGELKVDAKKFITDSTKRDSNVAEHLNSDTQPFISFIYTIENSQARGTMTINGVSKDLSFPVVTEANDAGIQIDGNITIKYTDFGMDTPSNLILSAHEDLVIGAKLYFNK